MGIKEQFIRIKENWLIIALVLFLVFAFSSGNTILSTISSGVYGGSYGALGTGKIAAMSESAGFYQQRDYYPIPSDDFAPEVKDRKITKTTSIATEVKRGAFKDSEARLKNIISSSSSYLLNENVNKYDANWKSYYAGYYQIKVEASKYDSVISQLKEIGEVKSFNEDSTDITGRYTDLQIELGAEKERLARYQSMYNEAKEVSDKIELSDRIFNQERTIKYLEDALKNMDKKVEYSTIYFTMTEKRSEYADIVLVKFSELIKSLVGSFNTLIKLIFVLAPWAISALVLRLVWKAFKKKGNTLKKAKNP